MIQTSMARRLGSVSGSGRSGWYRVPNQRCQGLCTHPALAAEAEVPSGLEWCKMTPLHRHVLLDARWCVYTAEPVVSDAEILKLRHVFQHTRESCEGEPLSVEAFGVVS